MNLLTFTETITPTRNFNLMYIIIDSIFLVFLAALLIWKKRYGTLLFGVFGGLLYLLVDYGGFYAMSHSRVITINGETADALNTFWVLLWMSLSYGFTNFVFIWTMMRKDPLMKYWLVSIILWWLIAPSIAEMGGPATIETFRTTGKYHGWMGVACIVTWFILIVYLLWKKEKVVNILYLLLIGVSVQFAWEFALLINGIRPMNVNSLQTLLVNSVLETNLGIPTIYLIYRIYDKYLNENLSKKIKEVPNETPQTI